AGEQLADVVDRAHAAADRQRHETGLRRALHDVVDGVAVLVARRDVEEGELVGPGRVIGYGRFHRIAGVAQVDEIDAFDDAAIFNVQAGNHAHLEHGLDLRPRAADQLEGLGRIEPPVVERAAGDRAFELARARLQHRLDIPERRKTAGRDDGNRNRLRQRDGGVEIEALEHPVARHVGVDDGGDAGVLETTRDLERGQLRRFRPAFDRDLAVARIETNRDLFRKAPRRFLDESRIAHRRRPYDDPVDALGEPAFHRGDVANSAAELHAHAHRLED